MKNKKLESMLSEIRTVKKIIPKERDKFTTTIDKEMLDDFKELCVALDKQFNVGFEAMLSLLNNNEEFLKAFLDEIKRR